MSDREQIILVGWLAVVLVMLRWMWLTVRRADKKEEEREAKQSELDADWEEWITDMAEKNQKGKVFDLPRGKELDFQARSRQAESLGFTDEPPKRAS